jgi:hypothetical protein
VSSLPLSFSEVGFPVTWGPVSVTLGGSVSLTISPPGDERAYVMQGIDMYAVGPAGVAFFAWYDLNGIAPVMFASETMDPAAIHAYTSSWRGSFGMTGGDNVTCTVEADGLATMGLIAWGVVLPVRLDAHY